MAITQDMCTSFKKELFQQIHLFATAAGDTFKIALFASTATLGPSTTVYATADEITGSGYVAGGNTLAVAVGGPTTASQTAWVDFDDSSWASADFTAYGALIYNSTETNKSVAALDFGGAKTVSAGTFTVQFPTADQDSAIIRIGICT